MDEYTCSVETEHADEVVERVASGLHAYDREQVGDVSYDDVVLSVRDAGGALVGGLTGTIGGGWLYVYRLWVDPAHRGRGLGSDLLRRAEQETLRCGCPRVFLNTLTWQSPEFYEKNGYACFARLEDAPAPHARVFYRKDLAP